MKEAKIYKPSFQIAFINIMALLLIPALCNPVYAAEEIDRYKGVSVYENGLDYTKSQGKHFARDGYYYGKKWQCVEHVKRFYKQVKKHKMPNVWGHARDYFDPRVKDGRLNRARGLVQYRNGSRIPPAADDILVFNDTAYGHVGIVTRVTARKVEIIQQNIYGKPRETYLLKKVAGRYYITSPRPAAGWLRKP